MNMSIKQKTWSKLSSLTSLNLDQVLIPSQNTCLSSCMVTWLSHDITLPPRHGWLHSSSRLLAWSDFVPGDLIRCQVVPLVITVAGGERRSAYSWRASLSALHTLGEGEVVQSTRQGYSWRTSFQTGFSTTKQKKKNKLNIVVSLLFVVVKCSQVYWISPYTHKFTSQSTLYKTYTCIFMCICKNEKSGTTKKPMTYELITLATIKTLGSMWHDSPFQTVFGTSEEFIYRKKLDIMK